jgi:hypothetical protein
MHPFTLSKVIDPASAISAAQDPHLAFIAGGTDLIGLMKDRAALPERLLDINGLPDMDHIEPTSDGGLRIGALARMSMWQQTLKYDVAFQSSQKAFCSQRPDNSETWPQWAATSCNAHAVPTFETKLDCLAISGNPVPAAPRATASTELKRSLDGPMIVLPPMLLMWLWPLPLWMPTS